MREDRERWDRRYAAEVRLASLAPAPFVVTHTPPRRASGRALDVACGAGRHALHLARRGFRTVGIDVSFEGVSRARRAARVEALELDLVVADLDVFPLPPDAFDVVVCWHFLDRHGFPALAAALRPGGVLLFETFTRDQLAFAEAHPRRPELLLAPNELLGAFPGLHVAHYEERLEHFADGGRATLASLVAVRRE